MTTVTPDQQPGSDSPPGDASTDLAPEATAANARAPRSRTGPDPSAVAAATDAVDEVGGGDGGEDGPAVGFDSLGLAPPIAQAVSELGYETPTAIQLRCIPHLLAGRDLLGQAQTGTGKTAAFALPLLSRVDSARKEPQVLVLTPTRELALQVAEAFQRYAHHLKGFHVLPIYGGQSYGLQVRQLQRVPQVIVGTPGRIMDHIRRGTLFLEGLSTLVLDEADEMLDMGFAEDIEWILGHTPAERQVALFSATMPSAILDVAREHLYDPVEVRIESATATVDTIDQQHCIVTRFHKVDVLTRLLEMEPFDGMLIFMRTKTGTTELADRLRAHGFAAEPLNGDMNQEMRERTVERLKGGQLDILVATDVAARGLDVERVSHVVNFDIPTDPSAYVHRIGRTGRAGRAGKAILMVEPRERGLLRSIERTIRRSIPAMQTPSAAELSASRIDRFTGQLRETLAEQDLDFFYRLVSNIAKDQELEPLSIAAALSFLLQRERPLDVREPERAARPERDARSDRGPRRGDQPGRDAYRPRRQDGARDQRRFGDERPPRFDRPQRDQRPGAGRDDDRGNRAWEGGSERRGPRPDRHGDPGPSERTRDERPFQRRHEAGGEERPPRQRRDRGGPDMVPHRIEVGHQDGVTPREIVGAIANESGLEGRFIGAIDIRDDHSTVDLPAGMPREIFSHLKQVRVCGRPLRISVAEGAPTPYRGPAGDQDRPRGKGPRGSSGAPRGETRPPRDRRFGGEGAGARDAGSSPPRPPRPASGPRRKRRD
jgi:ATP-dependent RNA helicase DeaD